MEFVLAAAFGARNQAQSPGRVPHVRLSVHPDFPVEFSGAGEFHAAFLNESRTRGCWWSPVQEIPNMGRKSQGAAPSNALATWAKRLRPRSRILAHGVKALEEFVFGPCTLRRTWGTRPEPLTVVGTSDYGWNL